jgi:hypothetical protein
MMSSFETWVMLKLTCIVADVSVITARTYYEGVVSETLDVYSGLWRRAALKINVRTALHVNAVVSISCGTV